MSNFAFLGTKEDWLTLRDVLKGMYGDMYFICTDGHSGKDIRTIWARELVGECLENNSNTVCIADSTLYRVITRQSSTKHQYGIPHKDSSALLDIVLIPPSSHFLSDPKGWKENAIIKTYSTPNTTDIMFNPSWLQFDLAIDLETTGLHPKKDKIISFSVALNQREAVSLDFDLHRDILEMIVKEGNKKLIFHNASFDLSFLVQEFFPNDWELPFEYLLNRFEDTKLIAWLALNSVSRPDLSLKHLAQPFAGQWSKDIVHTGEVTPELLEYGKIDAMAVWYVWDQYREEIRDQESLYQDILKPAVQDIVQMQLTGLPLDIRKVRESQMELVYAQGVLLDMIRESSLIVHFMQKEKEDYVIQRNAVLKRKRITIEDCGHIEFNPKSITQLRTLLYNFLGLTPIDWTPKGEASVSQGTIEKLLNQTEREDVISLLKLIIDWAVNEKMLSTYYPTFLNAYKEGSHHFLMGHFNLGGTVSGRLSSSNPNLQNLPATGTPHSKTVKSLFVPPKGWFLVGMDFDSLEDRISALLTKDPNKLKVYTDGYDGHSLRAYQYFKNRMPDIEDTVESINSIKERYPDLRQASKGPTFALTYQGSWKALERVCGLSMVDSKRIEKAYHEMYAVSDQWTQKQLEQAWESGFVVGAFGLKIRTPLMASTLKTHHHSVSLQKEMRTAGNALGQSWCLLNSRACSEVMREVRKANLHNDILPCAQIHDASYFLVRADWNILWWWYKTMTKAASWQEDEAIQHPSVTLSGSCAVYDPDWSKEISLKGVQNMEDMMDRIIPF